MKLPVLVFDLETALDLKSGAALHGLTQLDEANQYQALTKLRRQDTGSDFQRLPLHQIICISGLWIDEKGMRLFSFSQQDNTELELLEKFLSIFNKRHPVLVSWNGLQFDLPVILYRTMYHGLTAPNLFDQGELDYQRRFNNYQNRYHQQHIDLMDVMAMFNGRNFQKLDDIARFLGFPGQPAYQRQNTMAEDLSSSDWQELSVGCERTVINTWLIYLRWMRLKGHLVPDQHDIQIQSTVDLLHQHPQHINFLADWKKNAQHTAFTAQIFKDE
ncbi:ribonuclease H-like domain-containing protein [Acinetobacter apis]|uniref:Predicted 3'-5' exonuclease PolB-like domain-containing protein n=1 Tax=Acinetobacter apis TaxID=1229165 RepID=A0A217EFK3_9GAMM|nr:3'-5' exonuclease [Acinetobacter apis]SNQ29268.1 hypothetical protein SAMN05444584_1215 [Acinetobacter apis]